VGALTPLVQAAPQQRVWLKAVSAYTIGGAVTSACVGFVLALTNPIGSLWTSPGVAAVVVALVVLASAREALKWPLPLPQLRRQTNHLWVKRFGPTVAALLWGADLGFTFTTWFTYAGGAIVIVLAFASSQPTVGMTLILCYWAGRALNVWFGPYLFTSRDTSHELCLINVQARRLQLMHAAALGALAAVIVYIVTAQ